LFQGQLGFGLVLFREQSPRMLETLKGHLPTEPPRCVILSKGKVCSAIEHDAASRLGPGSGPGGLGQEPKRPSLHRLQDFSRKEDLGDADGTKNREGRLSVSQQVREYAKAQAPKFR